MCNPLRKLWRDMWLFKNKKARGKSLYRIVQSILTDCISFPRIMLSVLWQRIIFKYRSATYESRKPWRDTEIFKVNRYIELCNQLSRISNSYPRIGNSFPRIRQFVLSDCNCSLELLDVKSRERSTIRENGLLNCSPREQIVEIRESELSKFRERITNPWERITNPDPIRENGLHN